MRSRQIPLPPPVSASVFTTPKHSDQISKIWTSGKTTFIFSGRLTYIKQLRKKLDKKASTLEVLIEDAYVKWGKECIHHLFGDFSLCIWNNAVQQLWAVTTATYSSAQPLYWTEANGGVVIGSLLAIIKACPGVKQDLDFNSLALLLAAWVPENYTAYREIRKLPPGHALCWSPNTGPATYMWWKPEISTASFASAEDHAAEISTLFNAAVLEATPNSGPVGAQISGGLDSTLTASFAAHNLQNEGRSLHAWTQCAAPGLDARLEEHIISDEWQYARLISEKYPNIVHRKVFCGHPCLMDMFEMQHRLFETPVRNSANHQWINDIFLQAHSSGCKAVLTGYAGNFSVSYRTNRLDAIRETLKKMDFNGAKELGLMTNWKDPLRLLKYTVLGGVRQQKSQIKKAFLDLDQVNGLAFRDDLTTLLLEKIDAFPIGDKLRLYGLCINNAFCSDTYLLSGVEARDPTGDRRVVEALLKLPLAAYFYKNYDRAQARLMGRGRVPEQISWRTQRGVQAAEQAAYFSLYQNEYRLAWETVSKTGLPDIVGRTELQQLSEVVLNGHGSMYQAATFFRVLDVGLFVARSGQTWPDKLEI